MLMDRDDPHAAEPLFREAVNLRQHALPEGHWHVAEAQSLLGGCLTALGRYAEAEPLLRAAHSVLEKTRGEKDERTRQAGAYLAALYKASRYDLELRDYEGILEWINEYRPNPDGKLYIKDN